MISKNKYIVYLHQLNGKYYVGLASGVGTGSEILFKRTGNGGCRYSKQPFFWDAILKYGWGNVTTSILVDGLLDIEDARKYESVYIKLYHSNEPEFGYNCNNGDGDKKKVEHILNQAPSKEIKKKSNNIVIPHPKTKAVVGINVDTNERKTLPSRKAWDEFLHKGHGTAAQAVSGKPRNHQIDRWKLYDIEDVPSIEVNKKQKRSKPVDVYIVTKKGKKIKYGTYLSIADAANQLNVSHTSISKNLNNTPGYSIIGDGYIFNFSDSE